MRSVHTPPPSSSVDDLAYESRLAFQRLCDEQGITCTEHHCDAFEEATRALVDTLRVAARALADTADDNHRAQTRLRELGQ